MSLLKTNEIQNYNGSSLTLTASTVSTSAQLNTGGNISVTGSLNVSDDSTTRTNLGLGSMATQNANAVAITGGNISNATLASTNKIESLVGMIAAFATSSPPTGWLACQGQTLDSTTDTEYSPLFTVIGTTWGGTGSSSFLLPDLRGEFLRGWDNGRGVDSGRTFASAQDDAFQGHNFDSSGGAISGVLGSGGLQMNDTNSGPIAVRARAIDQIITDGVNGTPRTASETRSRNISILFCIRWK